MPSNRISLLDIFPAMEYYAKKGNIDRSKVFEPFLDGLFGDPDIEGYIQVWFCSSSKSHWHREIKPIVTQMKKYSKPFFYLLLGEPAEIQWTSAELGSFNVPSFINMEELVKNFSILVQESKNKDKYG